MTDELSRQEGLQKLRHILASGNPDLTTMIEAGPTVRDRFQPIFQAENLPKLSRDDFLNFLNFKNNRRSRTHSRGARMPCRSGLDGASR